MTSGPQSQDDDPASQPIRVVQSHYRASCWTELRERPTNVISRDLFLCLGAGVLVLALLSEEKAESVLANLSLAVAGSSGAIMGVTIAAAAIAATQFSDQLVLRLARRGAGVVTGLWLYEWVAFVALCAGVSGLAVLITSPCGLGAVAAAAWLTAVGVYTLWCAYQALSWTASAAGLRALDAVTEFNEAAGHDKLGGGEWEAHRQRFGIDVALGVVLVVALVVTTCVRASGS